MVLDAISRSYKHRTGREFCLYEVQRISISPPKSILQSSLIHRNRKYNKITTLYNNEGAWNFVFTAAWIHLLPVQNNPPVKPDESESTVRFRTMMSLKVSNNIHRVNFDGELLNFRISSPID